MGRGFKITELIVVVASVALIGSVLFPLIAATREQSRRSRCTENIKELSNAICEYYENYRKLPAASIWNTREVTYDRNLLSMEGQLRFLRFERPIEFTHENWIYSILSYLGAESTPGGANVPVVDSRNKEWRMKRIPVFMCVSDGCNVTAFFTSGRYGRAGFARGNYAINGGSQNIFESPGWLTNPRPGGVNFVSDQRKETFALWGNGVAGINKQFSFKDFENGVSHIVLLDEIRAGVSENDPRGTWALGQIGASITWGHGANGDDGGPNATADDSDDIRGCRELHETLGSDYLKSVGMPCCAHCNDNNQATARSMHPNGVNVAMADGSVHFVTNDIDIGLWHVMHSRLTPEGVLKDIDDNELAGAVDASDSDGSIVRGTLAAIVPEITGETTNSVGMRFSCIPAGEYEMGVPSLNNRALYPAEAAPTHPVQITRPFLLGIHEVTQSEFEQVMGFNPSQNKVDGVDSGNFPVENVSWDEAHEFCLKLSARPEELALHRIYRLPTEAEWEYAARAGRQGPIRFRPKWDDEEDLKSGVNGGKEWKPDIPIDEVAKYPANAFGVHDMCGNVFEWTNDWYAMDYYKHSPKVDPQGPVKGYLRVVRGSYWMFVGPACVANPASAPWERSPFIGFRVVCSVSPK